MNVNNILLLHFLSKEAWASFRKYISIPVEQKELTAVYKVLDNFWSGDTDRASITFQEFELMCSHHLGEENAAKLVLEPLRGMSVGDDILHELVKESKARAEAMEIALHAIEVSEGKKSFDSLLTKVKTHDTMDVSDQETFVTTDLEELYEHAVKQQGLRWRLRTLNEMLGSLRKGDFGFVFARPECFAKGTLILLSDGRTIPIEYIKAGMSVMGPDSTPRHVIATSKGVEKMYRISYSWGDSYVCNESHVLQLRAEGNTTTSVRVKDYLNWSNKLKHRFKQYKVGIELPHKDVKLDPYVLGLWLGDGTSTSPQFTNADEEVITYLQEWAKKTNLVCNIYTRENQGKAKTISICSTSKKHGANTFLQYLKSSRLLRNKHIPSSYLKNSSIVRLQLLAGLIDTDGCREKSSYSFCNKNELLIDQVVWLSRSLGLHAIKRSKIVDNTTYYVVGIYGDCYKIPVRITRKIIEKPDVKPKRNGLNFGFSITEEPSINEYYGIQVDKDSLYLLNDFTIVHNTGKTTFLASEVSYFAEQLQEGQVGLWFNNEEDGSKVQLRIIQASLGLTYEQLFAARHENQQRFMERTGGRIRLVDRAQIYRREVEVLCKKYNPGFIVFDQLDKIKGFDADREDLRLGTIYQWARELAKEYCPVIAVTQADGSGEGKKWLTMENTANAKTAKQAEADWILGIGKTNQDGFEYIRHFHLSKNKLMGDPDSIPDQRHGKRDVLIMPEIARFKDI